MTSTSATDPKFLVRFTSCSAMHERAKAAAKAAHMPLNSFVLQAIQEKLDGGALAANVEEAIRKAVHQLKESGAIEVRKTEGS